MGKIQIFGMVFPILLLFLMTDFVCHSDETAKNSANVADSAGTVAQDTTHKPGSAQNPAEDRLSAADTKEPASIKLNITRIVGTIRSVVILDTINFKISAHIDTASAIGEMPSFAETGSDLMLIPRYIVDSNGNIDDNNQRNKRLSSLRDLKTGSHFRGSVVRNAINGWAIVDADTL